MICSTCREAGLLLQYSAPGQKKAKVTKLHAKCKGGTWCDCQHKLIGVDWLTINREKDA